jgi:hypothetical protein
MLVITKALSKKGVDEEDEDEKKGGEKKENKN